MDAVQFGRWMSEQRRKHGWRSQRSLVETVRHNPLLSKYNISEDFLARLEAGQLAHPFRSSVRRRVLALAWLLCKTPRDLRTYLRAAEITEHSASETEYLNSLNERLVTRPTSIWMSLPPRPTRLIGRAALLDELTHTLTNPKPGVCAITGMPGVGKSALAYEAVHHLFSNEHKHLFLNGIATFSGTGRRGTSGLIALLNDIIAVFSSPAKPASRAKHVNFVNTSGTPASFTADISRAGAGETDLAGTINRTRLALSNKRVLILLDDLDAHFPLRQALEALLAHNQSSSDSRGVYETGRSHCVVLITSRYVPSPSLATHQFHVGPLEPLAALELFTALVGRSLVHEERGYAEEICAIVGYLPLAIEMAATAVTAKGIPLSLLAARLSEYPLDTVLDGEAELRTTLAQSLESLDPEIQKHFALLSMLGSQSFGLESAVAIDVTTGSHTKTEHAYRASSAEELLNLSTCALMEPERKDHNCPVHVDYPVARLANTAATVGQLVQHSLIELTSDNLHSAASPITDCNSRSNSIRYRLHPLLYAHAAARLGELEQEVIDSARQNILAYALSYIESYQNDVTRLKNEQGFLLAALKQAWEQKEYPLVVHFVRGLYHLIDGLISDQMSERLILWGIHASQQMRDQYRQARFLNHLGLLFSHRREFTHARGIWKESLEIAESLDRSTQAQLWYPIANLAYLASSLGEYDAAQHFAEIYLLRAQRSGEVNDIALGFFLRGFLARLRGDGDSAYHDLSLCVHLLPNTANTSRDERFFEMQVQAEFARVQGDYARAKECTEAGVSLVQGICDLSTSEMLFDQACYACQQGMFDDAQAQILSVLARAKQIGSRHLQMRTVALLQQLPEYLRKQADSSYFSPIVL